MAKGTVQVYETQRVKLSQVRDNENNARNVPTDEKKLLAYQKGIKDLADDIKVNGNIEPMVVIRTGDPEFPFEVKAGSRRWAALMLNDTEEVDIRIIPFKDAVDHELIGLAENMDREDLTTYDIAKRLVEVQDEHPTLTDNLMATRVGKSKSYVQNLMRVYRNLHPTILKEWAGGHGMATMNNLASIVKQDDKAEQLKAWKALCGIVEESEGGEGGEGGAGGGGEDIPKRNAKAAATAVLAAIVEAKGFKPEAKALAIEALQYVLNVRKSPPKGVSMGAKADKGKPQNGKGAKAA